MQRKYIWLIAIGLLILGVASYSVFMANQYPHTATIITQDSTRGSITLHVPQFENLPMQNIQNHLNEIIAQEVERFVTNTNQPHYSGQVNYEIQVNQNHIVSITIKEFVNVERAAHPMTYLKAFTMNTKTGQLYSLNDLFKPNTPYQEKINHLIQNQISQRNLVMLRPFTGIDQAQEFYLAPNSLVIYYQLYTYTPYTYGFLKFPIAYTEISDMLKNEILQAQSKTPVN